MVGTRPRTGAVVALVVALTWSLVVVVAALALPVYSGETTSSDGGTVSTRATLVEVNGTGVLGIVLAPLLASVLVAAMVWGRRRWPALGTLAWVATVALGLLALAGIMSVGVFLLPVVLALAVAILLSAPGPAPAEGSAP
ncbi:hypothetical protein EDD28_2921 [Salana multivorans]|uniref:Uncharacterized protein n=1 Tax=Salana multivorans TaxID=120377 RepID=A0A3N2D145_9MICO|nr:hypothetical protein [Salana multivorans]ROR93505.1 hypothetical protein EDD28_2921 [Salana multivorans]